MGIAVGLLRSTEQAVTRSQGQGQGPERRTTSTRATGWLRCRHHRSHRLLVTPQIIFCWTAVEATKASSWRGATTRRVGDKNECTRTIDHVRKMERTKTRNKNLRIEDTWELLQGGTLAATVDGAVARLGFLLREEKQGQVVRMTAIEWNKKRSGETMLAEATKWNLRSLLRPTSSSGVASPLLLLQWLVRKAVPSSCC
jgi:hypothetical protein